MTEDHPTLPPATVPPLTLLSPQSLGSLLWLAANSPPGGAFVEVGVYRGGVAWYLQALAARQQRYLLLFDTFTGIPQQHPQWDEQHKVGDFGDTSFEAVRAAIPEATYFVGEFPGTAPDAIAIPISFVHVDCDQYQAILDCIDYFWPKLAPAGVMLFDDYNCTTGCQQAISERFKTAFQTAEGKCFVRKGQALTLEEAAALEAKAAAELPPPPDLSKMDFDL